MLLIEMLRALCYLQKMQRKGTLVNMCGPQNFENMVCSLGTGDVVFMNLSVRKSLQARLDSSHIVTKDDDSNDLFTVKAQ